MEELKIVYLNPCELKPYEKNARKHDRQDIEAIKSSIQQCGGFNDPIGIWGKDNIIVEGHGRLIAAQEMGIDRVPCIRLDYLTDEQRKAYALAHNKTAELSIWDSQALQAELSELGELGFNMEDIGFEPITPVSVDDFFDRGVDTKEKPVEYGLKLVCNTQEELNEAMTILTEAGFSPERT